MPARSDFVAMFIIVAIPAIGRVYFAMPRGTDGMWTFLALEAPTESACVVLPPLMHPSAHCTETTFECASPC
jgi:hypothetical protein